jgi:hypothetical protein
LLPFVFCEAFINRPLFRTRLPNLDNINNLDGYQTRCLKTWNIDSSASEVRQ